MVFSSIPIIVICCYMFGETYKIIFNKNKKMNKLSAILTALFGGVLGILIFLTNPEVLYNDVNIWESLEIGIVSGASATGTSEIIKQIFKKEKENKNV